jgi:type IV secretory pathway VirB2 component (pilin)
MRKVYAAVALVFVALAGLAPQAHAATLSQGDFNSAITSTVQPIQDFITGFLANGWLVIVGIFLIMFAVALAWKLGKKGLHKLLRLGPA